VSFAFPCSSAAHCVVVVEKSERVIGGVSSHRPSPYMHREMLILKRGEMTSRRWGPMSVAPFLAPLISGVGVTRLECETLSGANPPPVARRSCQLRPIMGGYDRRFRLDRAPP
jgi:hypothetical protein